MVLKDLDSDDNPVMNNNDSTSLIAVPTDSLEAQANNAMANNSSVLANNNSMNWMNNAGPTDSLEIISRHSTTTYCYQAETPEKFSSLKNMVTNSLNPFISKFSILFKEKHDN